MLKIGKIKTKKIKDFLKTFPQWLAERTFLSLLIFIFLALILGGLFFYKYSFLIEKKPIELKEKPSRFNEKSFENVLKICQEREKKFKETESKEYPNPF